MADLEYIEKNILKLFVNSTTVQFTPLTFDKPVELEALFVLNKILRIILLNKQDQKNILYLLNFETLQKIINIKCIEFKSKTIPIRFGSGFGQTTNQQPSIQTASSPYQTNQQPTSHPNPFHIQTNSFYCAPIQQDTLKQSFYEYLENNVTGLYSMISS